MLAKKYKMNIVMVLAMVTLFISSAYLNVSNASEKLTLRSSNADISLEIELADTPEKRQTGLMHRSRLDPMKGMLFDYKKVLPISMWMKNTLIPLDMIFADRRGRIVYIKEQAQPGDLSIVSAPSPVLAVLEVNGGFARKYGIKEGDLLIHPLFGQ